MQKRFRPASGQLTPEAEQQLWVASQHGNKTAFEQLYRAHFDRLVGYGRRICPDTQLIEDAIQDVFVDLWRRKTQLAEVQNLRYYLFRALRNQLTRNGRNDIFEGAEDIDTFLDLFVTLSAEQHSIEQETMTEQTRRVGRAVAQLSKRQQEAIHLRFYQGLSLNEMTSLMSLSKQSVSNLLFKAYAILRTSINAMLVVWCLLCEHGL